MIYIDSTYLFQSHTTQIETAEEILIFICLYNRNHFGIGCLPHMRENNFTIEMKFFKFVSPGKNMYWKVRVLMGIVSHPIEVIF